MSRRRRTNLARRDQDASIFTSILQQFCEASGALAAALVDQEGETVDYACRTDPFEIKVAAAEWCLILKYLKESRFPSWPDTRELLVRAARRSYLAVALSEGYALVIELPRFAFRISSRALAQATRDLCLEAGLPCAESAIAVAERWARVRVRTAGDMRRPAALWHDGKWRKLVVLGRYLDLADREIGFRARLRTGAEFALVREPLGRWYAGDL
jgi:hypothetical protein